MKFGTDGIRGVFGSQILPQHAFCLGKALGTMANRQGKPIIVATDTRESGKILKAAFVCGVIETGTNVVCLGVAPTPAVAFYTQTGAYSFGVSITASHNPWQHNGLKVFSSSGKKLTEKQEKEIESQINQPATFSATGCKYSQIVRKKPTAYTKYVKSNLPSGNLKIVIDCANGATARIAKNIFQQSGHKIYWLGTSPNGKNINQNCGSTNPQKLIQTVTKKGCNIGFAFDGDGDRILAVDEKGNILSGDHILFILAKLLKKENRKTAGVVSTILSSSSLSTALGALGLKHQTTQVGDKNVKEQMDNNGWMLGGEKSGHIIIADKCQTGDGMLVATELVRAMLILNQKASKLASGFVPLAEYSINVQNANNINEAQKAAQELNSSNKDCRVIIRKSGTENLVRIFCEAQTTREAKQIATYFEAMLLCHF